MSYNVKKGLSQSPYDGGWEYPYKVDGLGDLAADRVAGRAFIMSATAASRAKFQFQDRIHKDDISPLIGSIATFIAEQSGSANENISSVAGAIVTKTLCPENIAGGEHLKNNGYRLNGDTLNQAGDAIGDAISQFRSGVNGGGGGTGDLLSILTSPWVLAGAAGLGLFWWLKRTKRI